MSYIDDKYLKQLRERHLHVSQPFQKGRTLEDAVRVAKPATVPGNFVLGFESECGEIPINAPALLLRSTNEGWVVLYQDHVPTPGPGDFENIWQTPQEAVDDILDFYFGNPERMNTISQLWSSVGKLKK